MPNFPNMARRGLELVILIGLVASVTAWLGAHPSPGNAMPFFVQQGWQRCQARDGLTVDLVREPFRLVVLLDEDGEGPLISGGLTPPPLIVPGQLAEETEMFQPSRSVAFAHDCPFFCGWDRNHALIYEPNISPEQSRLLVSQPSSVGRMEAYWEIGGFEIDGKAVPLGTVPDCYLLVFWDMDRDGCIGAGELAQLRLHWKTSR